jgi:hypothetical protein
MSRLNLCLCLLLGAAAALRAAPPALPSSHVTIAPMKTSIYVGSVTLTTSPFEYRDGALAATYEAKVWPWFFWGETGHITIQLPLADLGRVALGQTVEFTGSATNQKQKPRTVTGRAQPTGPTAGKIKVRIKADGTELIFNGTYQFAEEKLPDRS